MGSLNLKPQFITDDKGNRTAVILSLEQYEELTDLLEDRADSAEIERRKAEAGIPHEEAMRLSPG